MIKLNKKEEIIYDLRKRADIKTKKYINNSIKQIILTGIIVTLIYFIKK